MDSADSRDEEVPLVVDNLQRQTPKNYTRDVHILSFAFLLIFLAYGAAQNLESIVNAAGDLRTISLGILYVSFSVFSLVASLVIVGNLISLALLRDGEDGSTRGTILLFTVFLCSMTLSTILMCFLHKTDNRKEKGPADSSAISLSKSVIAPLLDKRMLLIIPLFAYMGLQAAFVWADFTKEIVKPALGESCVGGAMVVLGAFDVICSVVAGRLTSGLKSITFILCGGLLVQAVVFLWLLLKYSMTTGVLGIIYPLLTAGLLGVGDAVLHTQLSALLALLFNHETEGAFAQMRVWQSAVIAVIFFLSPHISFQTMVLIMLAGICVSLLTFLFVTLKVGKAFSSPKS
ncbi:hypothetical protein SLA2020_507320 [Shorea laevis]